MFIRTPNSPAESLSLSEAGGVTLVLNERFLPYRPITIGGKQRAEFTWYPGSPEATVQMLGPEEGTIQLRGFWKDKFFTETAVSLGQTDFLKKPGLTPLSEATLPTTVAALVQVVDDMRRMGRQITLSWSGLVRVGHITSFQQTWHNIHDCEWEIEFSVLSQGEQTVPTVESAKFAPADVYSTALKRAVELQDTILTASRLPWFISKTDFLNNAANAAQLYVTAVANAAASTAQGYAGGVSSIYQSAKQVISSVTGGITNLKTTATSIGDSALGVLYSWGIAGSQDNVSIGEQLAAESDRRAIANQVRLTEAEYAQIRQQIAQDTSQSASQVQTYVAVGYMDLRDVSLRYYGTSEYWLPLMIYNNLQTSRLVTGQAVRVPPTAAGLSNNPATGGA